MVSLFTKTVLIVYEDTFTQNVSWSLKPAKWHASCMLVLSRIYRLNDNLKVKRETKSQLS